jgi:uncharacterized membrane protein (UPF0127 family)
VRVALLALTMLAAPFAACGGDDDGGPAQPTAAVVTFNDGDVALTVEVADEPAERSEGLSGRNSLAEDAGMLFVYTEDSTVSFTMRETLVPLSIAFVAADGRIVDIQDMEPLSQVSYASPEPFRYAIEANQGWFADNDVSAGELADVAGALP